METEQSTVDDTQRIVVLATPLQQGMRAAPASGSRRSQMALQHAAEPPANDDAAACIPRAADARSSAYATTTRAASVLGWGNVRSCLGTPISLGG